MDTATTIGLVAFVVLGLLIFGAALGLLIMSNYRLRQEVHSLREQVAALTRLLTERADDPWRTYGRGPTSARGRRGPSSKRALPQRRSNFLSYPPDGPDLWLEG